MKKLFLLTILLLILLPSTKSIAQRDTTKAHTLDEVEVIEQGIKRYADTVTSLGTRIPTKQLDLPQTIQSISLQVIKDQQALNVNELTKNVPGVSNYGPYSYYVMRGFASNYDMSSFTTNGMRGTLYDFSQQTPTYNLESVDLIKGPASALFSVGAPGGVMNFTTKQPKSVDAYEASVIYGSYNQYRLMADATGALTKSKKLLYRLILGNQNQNSFRNYVKGQNIFAAPSIAYHFSERTSLVGEINFQYDNTNIAYDRGVVATTNPNGSYNFNAVPLSWSRHDPNDHGSRTNFSAQVRFQHKISDHFTFSSYNRYAQYKLLNYEHDSWGSAPVNDSIVDRIYEVYIVKYRSFSTSNFVSARFNTGSVKHTTVAGADFSMYWNPIYYDVFTAPSISLYASGIYQDNPSSYNNLIYHENARYVGNRVIGGYIQDQIDLSQKFKALLGLRYDNYNFTMNNQFVSSTAPFIRSVTSANALLPRVGLVYQPLRTLSVYGSYCQSYNPNYNNSALGGKFAPEQGKQLEFGVKDELFNGKLLTTVAVFQIDKTNVLEPDPTDPNALRQLVAGSARSKGVEFSMVGNITSQLNIVANYAYTDARITKDDITNTNVGSRLPCAAPNMANIWMKYNFFHVIKGFGIGAGAQYLDKRTVSVPSYSFEIPSFVSYQAAVNYRVHGFNIGLNVYNIGNTRNFTGGYGQGVLFTEPPRNFRLSLTYSFK